MENITLYPVWREAIKQLLASGLTYGSMLTKNRIVVLCELPELLRAHAMLMVSNFDGSYRIVAPQDQTGYAVEAGARSIAKEMRRMALAVQYTNLSMLDDQQRRKNADAQAKIAMLAGMMHKGSAELRQVVD
jgi:hypothetical protein